MTVTCLATTTPAVRRAALAATEVMENFTADARPAVNTTPLLIRRGDIVDVGILWGRWLTAQGMRIKSSAWAAAGDPVPTPDSPTLVANSQLVNKATGETAVMIDTSAATEGDEYYLDNTVVLEWDPELTVLAFPDRTAIRRIHVKVAAG